MKPFIRIASGQGFWGDLQNAPVDQVRKGPIDYLVMDYLAEVTMSILHKQKRRDPSLGYVPDLIYLLEILLPDIVSKNIRIITNGGGVNPLGCREAIITLARRLGIRNLRVGVVYGDDLIHRIDSLVTQGVLLENMETGEPLSLVRSRLVSANAYLGAFPIVEALKQGAHLVIAGRTTDTSLTAAPMIYEFNWPEDDWNRLSAGIVAGHILECGGQASGGNFCADWKSVPDLAHIGFPIAEAYPEGTIVITKHAGTGGLVSMATVKEQLLYEIGDPQIYITPDCVVDFTSIQLKEAGNNRVEVRGVQGSPPTPFYKVSMAYFDGYTAYGTLTYAWPDALEKARTADAILRSRLANLKLNFDEIHTEFLGFDSCFGPNAPGGSDLNEVVMRIGVRCNNKDDIDRFSRELAPLILTGPPSVTGFGGGRPRPIEVISYWPALVPKSLVTPEVSIEES